MTSIIIFGLLRVFKLLRASEESERLDLDQDHHMGYTGILRYLEEVEATKGHAAARTPRPYTIQRIDAREEDGPKSHAPQEYAQEKSSADPPL